jgi:SH3-like domain-containing protein
MKPRWNARIIRTCLSAVLGLTLLWACATEKKTAAVFPQGASEEVTEDASARRRMEPAEKKTAVVFPQGVSQEVTEDASARRRMEAVTVGRLNVRMLPVANSKIVGVLRENERVEVKGQFKSWVKILREDGTVGWVLAPGALTGFPGPLKPKEPSQPKGAERREETASPSVKHSWKDPNETAGETGVTPSDATAEHAGKKDVHAAEESSTQQGEKTGAGEKAAEKKVPPDKEVVFLEVVPSEKMLTGRGHPPRNGKGGDVEQRAGEKGAVLSSGQAHPEESHAGSAGPDPGKAAAAGDTKAAGFRAPEKVKAVIAGAKGSGRMIEIKSAPLSSAGNVWEVRPGTRLIVIGKEGRWYRVESVGGRGYLHEDFVREIIE